LNDTLTFSGWFSTETLSEDAQRKVAEIAENVDSVYISENSIEIESVLQRPDRKAYQHIVQFLSDLARQVGAVDGQATCDDVMHSARLEYFTIRDNKLYCQVGQVRKSALQLLTQANAVNSDLITYQGRVVYPLVSSIIHLRLKQLFEKYRLTSSIDHQGLEVSYAGRDANRWYLEFLKEFAQVVPDARGDILCRIEAMNGEQEFEFYYLQEGRVYWQEGKVVRGPQIEVLPKI
jgi:hypothetical protein